MEMLRSIGLTKKKKQLQRLCLVQGILLVVQWFILINHKVQVSFKDYLNITEINQ